MRAASWSAWKPRSRRRDRSGSARCAHRLPPFGSIDVRALAVEDFRRFHDSFGKRRMWVDSEFDVGSERAHFDRKGTFRDEVTRAGTANANTEHAFGPGIDDELGESVGAFDRHGAPGSAPRELCDRDFDVLLFGLRLGETAPRNLGIGE